MDVFALGEGVLGQYRDFARSFTRIRSPEILSKVDELYAGGQFWPEPLVQLNPHYERGNSIGDFVAAGDLDPRCAEIFIDQRAGPSEPDKTLKLHRHQSQAVSLALGGRSYVVTTGTGSGKSLCFFIPIIDAALKDRKSGEAPRTRAVIIYPMNALANSQLEELKKYLGSGPDQAVTFARYTGQESKEERERIRANPPDILLTNFMMLELLMTRQNELDRKVIENCRGLQFMVLDELHTYRGRQGADVAMLMRRLRARIGNPNKPPICVGTSATMASEGEVEKRSELVAETASRLFGTQIGADAVVTETLKRATSAQRSADTGLPNLAAAVERAAAAPAFEGEPDSVVADDNLAIWVETRLGLKNVEKKPERATPVSITEAVVRLAADTNLSSDTCEVALKSVLLALSTPEADRGVQNGKKEPFFAFKLHQFIAGAGRLYVTLDAEGSRTVTCDGQVFDPDHPEKRLYAAHFCRNCGQEFHPVTIREDQGRRYFEKREIDDVPGGEEASDDDGEWGFLMPEPADPDFTFGGADEDYPEQWLEETKSGARRLKSNYRRVRAQLYDVSPDGTIGSGRRRAWFLPRRFVFCPTCGDVNTTAARDINKLASLSAEGRSSATTVIISAILRWMNREEAAIDRYTRKLLSFTDNRQDAALQAGHFNDFIFVSLLRGAILGVIKAAGEEGLQEADVGARLQQMLGFLADDKFAGRREEWLVNVGLKGGAALDAEKLLRDTLMHRFWIDQRKGWRYTNPNLEQLGLLSADYEYLDDMSKDDSEFADNDILKEASASERAQAMRAILDHMRKGLAVDSDALDRLRVENLSQRMRGVIKAPWMIEEERLTAATVFMTEPPRRKEIRASDEVRLVRGTPQSAIGRLIKSMSFAGAAIRQQDATVVIDGLLKAAHSYGLVSTAAGPVGGAGWRIVGSRIRFATGKDPSTAELDNPFFRQLYETMASLLESGGEGIFGLEGREHTAQVEALLREIREARFRYGKEDQTFLQEKAEEMREAREDARFLPTLFCSPTMELGVDISAMNVVYMRNAPPTPANYAQRSGRAGRSGQPALIVTYCAAQSPHDQYFFARRDALVDGIVVPPAIDLTNPDLVASHLHAEWLAASLADLETSIHLNLDMAAQKKPVRSDVIAAVTSEAAQQRARTRLDGVLAALERDYGAQMPSWYPGRPKQIDDTIAAAPENFERAFDRWRDLLTSAEETVESATRTLEDYSISPQERKAAEARQRSGNQQIRALLSGAANQNTDFYLYRYLATEGFLPGYNFPRLPLMAYVPGGADGKGQRYIQRARFLAISEFGPGSLIYHEGRAFRVNRAMLRDVGEDADGLLTTFSIAVCPQCGACHNDEPPERCHVCSAPLSTADHIRSLYRIDNVDTRPVERITANDEDRRRQGFELQTTFSFEHASGTALRRVEDRDGEIITACFAQAAHISRINKGLRRRKEKSDIGFEIDPKTGRWLGKEADEGDPGAGPQRLRQKIVPVVSDRKNVLLVRFPQAWLVALGDEKDTVVTTIQHALARGIEAVYQLEEGEILVEPTPARDKRLALLFYESAEGGAGALSQLLEREDGFRRVAAHALGIMHFDRKSIEAAYREGTDRLKEDDDPKCVAGCYRCVLSYFNQMDHELIDRRHPESLRFLLRLAHGDVSTEAGGSVDEGDDGPLPPHDDAPLTVDGHAVRRVWRQARVAALAEGEDPPEVEEGLRAKGVQVVWLPADPTAREQAEKNLQELLKG